MIWKKEDPETGFFGNPNHMICRPSVFRGNNCGRAVAPKDLPGRVIYSFLREAIIASAWVNSASSVLSVVVRLICPNTVGCP